MSLIVLAVSGTILLDDGEFLAVDGGVADFFAAFAVGGGEDGFTGLTTPYTPIFQTPFSRKASMV